MPRHRRAATHVALAVVLSCSACIGDPGGSSVTRAAIEASLGAAATAPSRVADLGSAVPGPWTRLVFACAYSDPETVARSLGFAWPDYQATDQDGENTWIFATEDEVVSWAVVLGYHGDPCWYDGATPETVTARQEARFRVEDTGERVLEGVPYRALRPLR